MAARGEDNLTQIQKYKAMLKSRRTKGDEKATRRPKKTRLSKGSDETAPEDNALTVLGSTEETPTKSNAEDFKQENFDLPKLETNTDLSTEPKQSPVLSSTNADDIVDPKSITAEETKDNEIELVTDGEKKDEQKKEKSKGLLLRRKKKSKKRKISEEKVAPPVKNEGKLEEDLEEKYSWKESAHELQSSLPLSKDTTQDDNQCVEESPGQNLEADEYETIEEPDGKEKISRAKKFKRWAKFGKGKKASAAVDLENREPNNSSIQDPESLDDGTGETAEEGVEKSTKEEPVGDEEEDLEPPPLPQKERRRSSSLNEPTDKGNESLSFDNAQRIRSASLGKENLTSLPPKRVIQEENIPVEKDSEKESSQKAEELDEQNNEEMNDVNNEQALAKQKTEDEREEQPSSDNKETGDSSAKDDQPKKKKKGLLRKISSKNPKASKKDYETRETSKKPKISAPLLVKYESLTGSDVLSNAKPIEEASPEKPIKRKKSGLNLKLPKALKRPKASDYQVIGGAEAEKERKQDEMFQQNDVENSEAADEEESREEEESPHAIEKDGDDAENKEVAGSGKGESEGNNSDDGETYSTRLALMKDVLKELIDRMETNEELIHHAADTSQQITGEEKSQVTKDKEQPEQPSENSDEQQKGIEEEQLQNPDTTVQKDEENEENPEPKEQKEHQDSEKSSDETEEIVQKSLDLEPKEPEKTESEPNTTENEPEPEDVTKSCEDEIKQPEEMPKEPEETESGPNTTENEPEPEDVTKSCEDEIKQPEEMPKETEEPNNQEDSPKPEDVPTKSEEAPNKDNPELEDVPEESEDEPKESEDSQASELSESQTSETSYERSADDKVMSSEATSNFFSNGVSTLERSIEASMMTRALIDTYILIDHSLQLSEDFLKCVEMMDLNSASARSSRCNIM